MLSSLLLPPNLPSATGPLTSSHNCVLLEWKTNSKRFSRLKNDRWIFIMRPNDTTLHPILSNCFFKFISFSWAGYGKRKKDNGNMEVEKVLPNDLVSVSYLQPALITSLGLSLSSASCESTLPIFFIYFNIGDFSSFWTVMSQKKCFGSFGKLPCSFPIWFLRADAFLFSKACSGARTRLGFVGAVPTGQGPQEFPITGMK